MLEMIRLGWGREDHAFATAFAKQFQPDGEQGHLRSWCELQRRAATPEQAVALSRVMYAIDIRTALGIIGCPTLVIHANRDAVVPVGEGRLLAKSIPNAQYLELDTQNHFMRTNEPAWKDFVAAVYDFLPAREGDDGAWKLLTEREREVLEQLASGLDNHEIAAMLAISEKTVRNHVSHIFATLGLPSRSQLIVAARKVGFGAGSDPGR
jgi:DNA-binding CsgD family transcriptional regulator